MRLERLLRWWLYFRRGHSTYLAFLLSFTNFVVIQYRLLVQYVPLLNLLFANLISFALAFLLVYAPVATLIGWLDFKRGSRPVESAIVGEISPWIRDLFRAIYLLAEGRSGEAKRVAERWARWERQ